jgi:hypothetical protein
MEASSMKKLLLSFVVVLAAALAGTGSAATTSKTVTVAMRDPGCHWFLVGGAYKKSLSVSGPVSLVNFDEAALKLVGPSGVKFDGVGKKLALGRGVYHITMVKQAADDNHLLLTVH